MKMKKNISMLLLLFVIFTAISSLAACGSSSDNDLPEGLQLVRGGEELGYYFYGPEGWVVANQGAISASYVSSIDYSSITFTTLDDSAKDEGAQTVAEIAKSVFAASAERYASSPFSDYQLVTDGAEYKSFGNAEKAYAFTFTYTYEKRPYKCMQIISSFGGELYIFTYNASTKEYTGQDKSFYDFYFEQVDASIKSFKFTEKIASDAQPEYERDQDGFIKVSEKSKAGFELYLPDDYRVNYSSAVVGASRGGANITMTKLINSTVSIKDNYLARIKKLSKLADKEPGEGGKLVSTLNEIKGVKVDENGNESLHILEIEGTRSAAEFEYEYTLFGVKYHVYEVVIVQQKLLDMEAFVFTLTATEDAYDEAYAEVADILRKIGY